MLKNSGITADPQSEDLPQNVRTVQEDHTEQVHELLDDRSYLLSMIKALEMENVRLEMEKAEAQDAALRSHLEKDIVAVVVKGKTGEKLKCVHCVVWLVDGKDGVLRLEKGSVDRAMKEEVDIKVREVDVLKEKVAEVVKVLNELKKVNEVAVRDRIEMNASIERMEKENYLSFGKALECLGNLAMEKREIELENNEKAHLPMAEIAELREAHKTELINMKELASQLKHKLELTQQHCETQIDEKKKLDMELQRIRIHLELSNAEKVRAQVMEQESDKRICGLVSEKRKLIEAKEAAEVQVKVLLRKKVSCCGVPCAQCLSNSRRRLQM